MSLCPSAGDEVLEMIEDESFIIYCTLFITINLQICNKHMVEMKKLCMAWSPLLVSLREDCHTHSAVPFITTGRSSFQSFMI